MKPFLSSTMFVSCEVITANIFCPTCYFTNTEETGQTIIKITKQEWVKPVIKHCPRCGSKDREIAMKDEDFT